MLTGTAERHNYELWRETDWQRKHLHWINAGCSLAYVCLYQGPLHNLVHCLQSALAGAAGTPYLRRLCL